MEITPCFHRRRWLTRAGAQLTRPSRPITGRGCRRGSPARVRSMLTSRVTPQRRQQWAAAAESTSFAAGFSSRSGACSARRGCGYIAVPGRLTHCRRNAQELPPGALVSTRRQVCRARQPRSFAPGDRRLARRMAACSPGSDAMDPHRLLSIAGRPVRRARRQPDDGDARTARQHCRPYHIALLDQTARQQGCCAADRRLPPHRSKAAIKPERPRVAQTPRKSRKQTNAWFACDPCGGCRITGAQVQMPARSCQPAWSTRDCRRAPHSR